MIEAVVLTAYGALLLLAAAAVWRRPLVALYLFIVGLALHNLAGALLFDAGVRGVPLDVVLAWKETLLTVALGRVILDAVRARRLPFRAGLVDALALGFATLALLYALVPQRLLDGDAGPRAVLYGLRHAWLPVAAYFLGRALALSGRDLRRLGWTVLGTAAAVAAIGLVDLYSVSVEWWRGSGAVGYFRDQLGFDYHGPANLPDNWAFNSDEGLFRRLVSTFISPLGAAFMLVVALLLAASPGPHWLRLRVLLPLVAVMATGLLFTVSRASLLALAGGLVVLAYVRRLAWLAGVAAATVAVGIAFALAFPSIASETHFFPADLAYQEQRARELGDLPEGGLLSPDEPSIRSHLISLREGLETVARHPQGYGLGNAGAVASRFNEPVRAGESNYAEFGVELGLLGLVLFVAWSLALLASLVRRARRETDETVLWAVGGLAAAFAAILALAVQSDVYGVPWLAFCVWWLCGGMATVQPLWQSRSIPAPTSGTSISRSPTSTVHSTSTETSSASS